MYYSYKYTDCKSLSIKATANCPKCICTFGQAWLCLYNSALLSLRFNYAFLKHGHTRHKRGVISSCVLGFSGIVFGVI